MTNFYDGLGTEDKQAVDAKVAEHKIKDKRIISMLAMAAVHGNDAMDEVLKTLKDTAAAAAKGAGGGGGGGKNEPSASEQKAKAEAKVKELQAGYDKAVESKNIKMQISFKNRLQAAVNELKSLMS